MSSLENKSLDKLFDIVLNVLWQDLLQVWSILRKKMDAVGPGTLRGAFANARQRLLENTLKDSIEVRWGMSLCPLCNDNNIEKNGIAYVSPSGDGLEFNQCLNCRIGILYVLQAANAKMDTYTVGLGAPRQFNNMSFYWDAVIPAELHDFWPMYEIIHNGQWIGSISIGSDFGVRYLPFDAMSHEVPRGSPNPWTKELPPEVQNAIEKFIEFARDQIEVALVLK